MKRIIVGLALLLSLASEAQVTKIELQASGLTCSMCSNAINKALKTLDFVEKINANVGNYIFEITVKPGMDANFDDVRKKVEGAGFSVAGFTAFIHFDQVIVKNGQAITVGPNKLFFQNSVDVHLDGIRRVQVLDKGFLSDQQWKATGLSTADTPADGFHVQL